MFTFVDIKKITSGIFESLINSINNIFGYFFLFFILVGNDGYLLFSSSVIYYFILF